MEFGGGGAFGHHPFGASSSSNGMDFGGAAASSKSKEKKKPKTDYKGQSGVLQVQLASAEHLCNVWRERALQAELREHRARTQQLHVVSAQAATSTGRTVPETLTNMLHAELKRCEGEFKATVGPQLTTTLERVLTDDEIMAQTHAKAQSSTVPVSDADIQAEIVKVRDQRDVLLRDGWITDLRPRMTSRDLVKSMAIRQQVLKSKWECDVWATHESLGLLTGPQQEALKPIVQQHRRYLVALDAQINLLNL